MNKYLVTYWDTRNTEILEITNKDIEEAKDIKEARESAASNGDTFPSWGELLVGTFEGESKKEAIVNVALEQKLDPICFKAYELSKNNNNNNNKFFVTCKETVGSFLYEVTTEHMENSGKTQDVRYDLAIQKAEENDEIRNVYGEVFVEKIKAKNKKEAVEEIAKMYNMSEECFNAYSISKNENDSPSTI